MSQSRPYLVSVITPVYNCSRFLSKAFRSVQKQSIGFDRIEYILVDDHSTDGSYELLLEFAKKYSNVKVARTEHNSGGASAPRNLALRMATAEYLMFLDGDDTLEPRAVETLYRQMENDAVDLVSGCYCETADGRRGAVHEKYRDVREGIYDFRRDVEEWFPILHPIVTKLYKRDIIIQNQIYFDPELRNGEDSLFLFQYMKYSHRATHLNKLVYNYRIVPDSLSHSHPKSFFTGMLLTYRKIYGALCDTDLKGYYDLFLEKTVSACMDIFCDCDSFSREEVCEVLEAWQPVLSYVGNQGIPMDTAVASILSDDAKRGDFEGTLFHFFALRPMYDQKRKQMEEILNSRAWRLIVGINRLIGRG